MRLYLLRHAEAEPPVFSDAARALTPRGIEQARLAGQYCRQKGLRPELLLTSPYRRTVQTGEIVACELQGVTPQAEAFLTSGMQPEQALAELGAYARLESLLLVGHQPDLGLLAAALLGNRESADLPFRVASLAGLGVERFAPGGGRLELFVSQPQMLAGLSEA